MNQLSKDRRKSYAEIDVDDLFVQRQQVAVIWCTEDVQTLRPDLEDEQAWQVLQQCRRVHDRELGFNWQLIDCVADLLFPQADG